MLLLLVGCLTSQQHERVSQGRICTDNFTCCHTEIEAADWSVDVVVKSFVESVVDVCVSLCE